MNGSCQTHTHVRLKANYISTRTIKEKTNMQATDQPQYKQILILKQKMKLNISEQR